MKEVINKLTNNTFNIGTRMYEISQYEMNEIIDIINEFNKCDFCDNQSTINICDNCLDRHIREGA